MPDKEEVLMRDILVKLARIEENTKGLDEVSKNANRALSMGYENSRDIKDIKANNKWAWGFMIGLGISIITTFLLNK